MAPESPDQRAAIRRLHIEAFPSAAEAALVDQLRADQKVALSLVATEFDEVIGHLLLCRLDAPFAALGLAPLAVAHGYRRRGIAARLVNQAIQWARASGWSAIFVLGDPAFYERFGFSPDAARGFDCRYAGPQFMALPLAEALPMTWGRIAYPAAFAALEETPPHLS